MQITQGSLQGKKASVVKDVFKGYVLQVNGNSYRLKSDIEEIRLISKEESKSALKLFFIILLGCTLVGLIIALPMLIAHRKVLATIAIRTSDGIGFVAQADTSEWKVISKYVTAELPRDFELS